MWPKTSLTTHERKSEVKYGVRSPYFIWASGAQLYSLAETQQLLPPPPPHLGSYMRSLLVSEDRRHFFVTPWREWRIPVSGLSSNPTETTSHWSPCSYMGIGDKKCLTSRWYTYCRQKNGFKVHKNENFFCFDFEFCTISLLVMQK